MQSDEKDVPLQWETQQQGTQVINTRVLTVKGKYIRNKKTLDFPKPSVFKFNFLISKNYELKKISVSSVSFDYGNSVINRQ